jgi:hypothetical protein
MNAVVHFRFERKDPNIEGHNIVTIPVSHLNASPESVLATLAETRWNSDPLAGKTTASAIALYPLDDSIKDDWCAVMLGDLIVRAYQYHFDEQEKGGNEAVLQLPPRVELEDCMPILKYYCLLPTCAEKIQTHSKDTASHLRALLYLRQLSTMTNVKDYIFECFKADIAREKVFIFTAPGDDMKIVHKYNNLPLPFVEISCALSEELSLKWVKETRLRDMFMASLEDLGLQGSFDANEIAGCSLSGRSYESPPFRCDPGSITWGVATSYNHEQYDSHTDPEYNIEYRHMLHVVLQKAPKKQRIE